MTGFGGFDSAQQLQAGVQRKLTDAPDSILNRLTQHRDAMVVMRDTFAANGRGFDDTEGEFAQAIAAITAAEAL
ncbi:hypothetical protein [Rhodococcus sp. NPDC058521]|uniref:hypothetical protein n=1 Tax=Rhodococcus sp. NPDC058521 TaxID=3346536 RepID=UPI00366163BD